MLEMHFFIYIYINLFTNILIPKNLFIFAVHDINFANIHAC